MSAPRRIRRITRAGPRPTAAIEPVESFSFHDLIEEEEQARGIWPTILAGLLIVAALGWLGFSGYALWTGLARRCARRLAGAAGDDLARR